MHLNGMPAVRKSPNVAVIGAGFSGLSCANVLKQSGANVTIFEARDRVGGRVRLSGSMIHGSRLLTPCRPRKPRSGSM